MSIFQFADGGESNGNEVITSGDKDSYYGIVKSYGVMHIVWYHYCK